MTGRPRLTLSARCRVIVDNDVSGDPDGLVALAHHLLSPTNRVVAVTSSFVNPKFPVPAPRAADPAAVQHVLAQRDLEIHQFPLEAYRQCAYSVAELEYDMGTSGALGRWLWSRFTGPHPEWVRVGGIWPLGDSPPVLVTALDVGSSRAETTAPDGGGAPRRTYTDIDFRLLVGDLLARLRAHGLRPLSTGLTGVGRADPS